MIDRSHALPLTRQAAVLKLRRSSLYYQARPVPPADLAIMRRIDQLHLDHPFAGSRMLPDPLRGEGVEVGRQRVATMMRRMGIEAIRDAPNRGCHQVSGLSDGGTGTSRMTTAPLLLQAAQRQEMRIRVYRSTPQTQRLRQPVTCVGDGRAEAGHV